MLRTDLQYIDCILICLLYMLFQHFIYGFLNHASVKVLSIPQKTIFVLFLLRLFRFFFFFELDYTVVTTTKLQIKITL